MATAETGFDDVTFDLISLQVRDSGGPRRQGAAPEMGRRRRQRPRVA